ncbi:hypothetical protein Patl1_03538 [Pistacia atlantica]|uniref:Uncharacterized protein n=1 Tax=Pistacia atlantica TaxID=434234 RepID=A0ACC1C6R6_9ROSI|nr:hypothetical protein Patl1_03538 [Pistacia atlantica]
MMTNVDSVPEAARFSELVERMMNETVTQAANSPKRFMTKRGNITSSQSLYSLAQCTQDLSSFDCKTCLQKSISQLRTTQLGGRMLFPSCYSRYELYPFYTQNVTAAPAVPQSPPLHASVTRPGGRSRISTSIIIAIIASIAVSVAWKHWRDETPLQLLDSTLSNSYSRDEVIRCVHVGLLCVQEDPTERPTMATIDLMLNSYSVTLPSPQQPAFYLGTRREVTMPSNKPCSVYEESITELYPR